MSLAHTPIIGTDALFQLISPQHEIWLGHGTFAMHPLMFDRVEPVDCTHFTRSPIAGAAPRLEKHPFVVIRSAGCSPA
jgi:hypothetical protein